MLEVIELFMVEVIIDQFFTKVLLFKQPSVEPIKSKGLVL